MFQCISGEYSRDTRVKSAPQQCGDAGLLKLFPVGPLPFVFKFRRIFRFIIGSIHIVSPGGQTGLHDRQVLIGKRQIQNHLRFFPLDQSCQLRHIACIHLRGCDPSLCLSLQFRLQGIAF